MNPIKSFNNSRRRFIGLSTGILSGLFLYKPGRAKTTKADIRHLLDRIELDTLMNSTPRKSPSYVLRQRHNKIILLPKRRNHPSIQVNSTGKMIWDRCNGRNSPSEIAKAVCRIYDVDPHQADVDCLCFLATLSLKGAVQL